MQLGGISKFSGAGGAGRSRAAIYVWSMNSKDRNSLSVLDAFQVWSRPRELKAHNPRVGEWDILLSQIITKELIVKEGSLVGYLTT